MAQTALKSIASRFHLTVEQVSRILELLESGFSIPYIKRYHKELAANLEAEDFYGLMEERSRLEKLDRRRAKILKKLQEREVLTDALEGNIRQAATMRELIDYYVPYRPRKHSRSRLALAQGLGPLATEVLSQEEFIADLSGRAEESIDPEEELETLEDVLEGVFHILCDWIAEEKSHRDRQREVMRAHGEISVRSVKRSLPRRLVREFKPYFNYRESLSSLHPYHMLVILRGKRMKALNYRIEAPLEQMERAAAELYLPGGGGQFDQINSELGDSVLTSKGEDLKKLNSTEFLTAAIKHSLENILAGIIAREMDRELSKDAESLALEIIRRNVKSMLMVQPVGRPVLGIHPGYRTGCNLAALGADGSVLETTTVYPHAPQKEREQAVQTICRLVQEYDLEVAAIGDGTGSEETEDLMAEIIGRHLPDLQFALIREVGLDAYCESRPATAKLPDVEPDERAAVSIGRRLLDPLSELVKINPRGLCPDPYADDVNGGLLNKLLDRVLEECVCSVGAEANKAHASLLGHLSGLDSEKAAALVLYRDENGPFSRRQQVREVPEIDRDSYDRAVGFLKVEESTNPLDRTRVHPQYYPVAQRVCQHVEVELDELASEEGREKFAQRRSDVQLAELEKEFGVHYLLLKDIVEEMSHPWPDPRAEERAPVLRRKRLALEGLEPDQWVEGTVRNIVDFGVFVDVGVGEDGLIHISELSEGYVETPYDVVCVGDRIRARVVRVDEERSRIALSLRESGGRREKRPSKKRRERETAGKGERKREAATEKAPVPDKKPGAAIRAPKSTVGWDSRRVQKAALPDRLSKTQQQILKKRGQPAEGSPEEEGEEEKGRTGGLLDRLEFANIERRGKPTD